MQIHTIWILEVHIYLDLHFRLGECYICIINMQIGCERIDYSDKG